jgi:hypothetical protein
MGRNQNAIAMARQLAVSPVFAGEVLIELFGRTALRDGFPPEVGARIGQEPELAALVRVQLERIVQAAGLPWDFADV